MPTATQAVKIIRDSRLDLARIEAETLRAWDLAFARILTPDLVRGAEESLVALRDRFLPRVGKALREVVRIEARAQAEMLGRPRAAGRATRKAADTVDTIWGAFERAAERADRNLVEILADEEEVSGAMGLDAAGILRALSVDRTGSGHIFRSHRSDWRDAIRALFRRVGSAVSVVAAEEVSRAA